MIHEVIRIGDEPKNLPRNSSTWTKRMSMHGVFSPISTNKAERSKKPLKQRNKHQTSIPRIFKTGTTLATSTSFKATGKKAKNAIQKPPTSPTPHPPSTSTMLGPLSNSEKRRKPNNN
jgi:hypothetical protein